MNSRTMVALCAALLLLVSACSGDSPDPTTSDSTATETTQAPEAANETADAEAAAIPTTAQEAPAPASQASGSQTATVTLDNGEVFEFSALCWLERQDAAGSEILFTVVSYDDPVNLDVTQFGAESFDGASNISLYDSTSYDTLWEASSFYGPTVDLTLDGSTVLGSGDFYPAGDVTATPVPGQLVATC